MNKYFLSVLLGCWGMGCLADDEALTLDELMPMFGWDFEATEITSEKVGDGLFVLFGVGGNIAVSVGEDGVMIVDNQFPEMMDKINEAIAALGGSGRGNAESPGSITPSTPIGTLIMPRET